MKWVVWCIKSSLFPAADANIYNLISLMMARELSPSARHFLSYYFTSTLRTAHLYALLHQHLTVLRLSLCSHQLSSGLLTMLARRTLVRIYLEELVTTLLGNLCRLRLGMKNGKVHLCLCMNLSCRCMYSCRWLGHHCNIPEIALFMCLPVTWSIEK